MLTLLITFGINVKHITPKLCQHWRLSLIEENVESYHAWEPHIKSLLSDKWQSIYITRKSKTVAVLQRRSMLKLGVICKFMNRFGKCFMSWNVHLEFQVLWLGEVISFSGILAVYAISATFCSLLSSVSK